MEANHDLERNRTPVQPEQMSAGRYLATRFTTLRPPLHEVSYAKTCVVTGLFTQSLQLPNPIRLFRLLNGRQWLFFLVGFLGCR